MEEQNNSWDCEQEGCTYNTDGKCLEGLDVRECPHSTDEPAFKPEAPTSVEEVVVETEDATIAPEDDFHEAIYSGDTLVSAEANLIAASSLSRLIILCGLPDVGKTTMLASLFDLFQNNSSVDKYRYAFSRSLIGFEKRCHHSRLTSGRAYPETLRTGLKDKHDFLHLRVQKEASGHANTNLLFTDIAGEYFNSLKNSAEECARFNLARRTDHFVVFINADDLSDISRRQNAKVSSLGILRMLAESKVLSRETYIEIVFSKWDLLLGKENKRHHEKYILNLQAEILEKLKKFYDNISFHKISSRSSNGVLEQGHGISNLLGIWVEKSPHLPIKASKIKTLEHLSTGGREFLNFDVK